jgi:hypothetical protein
MQRITFNLAEFRAIVSGKTLRYRVTDDKVELVIAPIPWTDLLRAILDGIRAPAGTPHDGTDPPEAREFLPKRGQR